jgi:hypothetical protein
MSPDDISPHTIPTDRKPVDTRVRRSRRTVLTAASAIALAVSIAACASTAKQATVSNSPTPTSTTANSAAELAHVATLVAPKAQSARLSVVAEFPPGYFVENLKVRPDGSILVTVLNQKQLYYILPPKAGVQVRPMLIHTFDQDPMDLVETQPDVFYLDTSNLTTDHRSALERVDLRHWKPGMPVPVQRVLNFPAGVLALNGSALLSPRVILVADSGAGLIWRVDLSADGMKGTAGMWLRDPSMGLNPHVHFAWTQPGVNGLNYDAKTGYLYYTATAYQLFMRVKVDPATLKPVGSPQQVASGWMWDDFAIDENANVAYATTHRQNTITRIPLDRGSHEHMQIVAGDPLDYRLLGPSSVAWGPTPQDYGRVAYISTDGGHIAPPPDGIVRPARVLLAEFP